jgi:GR25 family glycosyltransferase involved in LPS biosynthesis
MNKSIAILVSGEVTNINLHVSVIDFIRNQFSYIETVHIYFHMWDSNEVIYSENDINIIKSKVDFLYTDPKPHPLDTISISSLCVMLGVHALSKHLKQQYTYVCKWRNDVELQSDFEKWTEIVDESESVYITPPLLWMGDDGCNDHMGICKYQTFMEVFGDNTYEFLNFTDKNWGTCTETTLLIQLLFNHVKIFEYIPEFYYFHDIFVQNGRIIRNTSRNLNCNVLERITPIDVISRLQIGLHNYPHERPVKIAFHVNQFSIRGTEVAIFDYAYNNKNYLHNKSIIVAPLNHRAHSHPLSGLTYNHHIEQKFRDCFDIFLYKNKEELETILQEQCCDGFYILKSGQNDGVVIDRIPTFVHCVFKCSSEYKHGTVYACISNTINENYAPVVPHICYSLPKTGKNLRSKLLIPENAIVFGRHGGFETFDIDFVKDVIKQVVKTHTNIYFLFMNTEIFHKHPQIIHLDKTTSPDVKATFINTCNAMIHARKEGESFGLSIAEFTSMKKPIVTWKHDGFPHYHEHHNHLDVLGVSGMYYKDEKDLFELLTNFLPIEPVDYSKIYSVANVMDLFKKHFLSHIKCIKKYDVTKLEKLDYFKRENLTKLRILCNWKSSEELYKSWEKMRGNTPIQLVTSNPDYTVIINKPPGKTIFSGEKTIVMGMEPDTFESERWRWYGDKNRFLYFMDENYMNNCEWWLSYDKNKLLSTTTHKTKGDVVSSVISSQHKLPGHLLRIKFLKIAEKELDMDLYGWDNNRGFKSYRGSLPNGKEGGLEQYKYTFASENSSRDNYCTEKLFDAILSECLCFYWGCPNLDNFLDERCCIYLDITKPLESIEIIRNAIINNEWGKRLHIIRKTKKHILNYLSFFPRIMGLIKLDRLRKRTINLDHRPEKWNDHIQKCSESQLNNVTRFSAIIGSGYPEHLIKEKFTFSANFPGKWSNKSGSVGCALSHYYLWKEIIQKDEPILIMEDDVTFLSNFADKMGILLNKLETTQYDVVFIGHHTHEENYASHNLPLTFLQDNFDIHDLVPFKYMLKYGTRHDSCGLHGGGTFGYIMSPQGAKRMVDIVDRLTFYFPVDYMIIEAAMDCQLKVFTCAHSLVTSPKFGFDTLESDIQGQN